MQVSVQDMAFQTLNRLVNDLFEYVFCEYEKREFKFYGLRDGDVHATLTQRHLFRFMV